MKKTTKTVGDAVIDSMSLNNPEGIMGLVEYETTDGWLGVRDVHTGRLDELPAARATLVGPGVRAYEEGWLT